MQAETSARPSLAIYLFGRLEVLRGNQLLPPLATQKTQSLLAYLVIHSDRRHLRNELATLLWGDRDDVHAHHSLTTALWRIRKLLGKDVLLTDSTSVQFDPNSPFWLDIAEFEKRVKMVPGSPADLATAIDLYRGDLLEGFYDDWCMEERYYLESLYLDALNRLVNWHEAQRNHEQVRIYTQKYLAHDPLMQHMHLARIRALLALGDLAGARHQWQLCCETRQQELHALPSPEVLQQAEHLLGADFTIPLFIEPLPVKTPPRWNLLERPPFVGRRQEMALLYALWEQTVQGRGHMVFISGEAGVGKTRLTEEFAALVRRHAGRVARGHCFEPEHVLPNQLLSEILYDLNRQENRALLGLPAWAQNELARLVPELYPSKAAAAAASLQTSMQPEQQAILFNAIATLIRQFATPAPLLIILEDLHRAAETSLAAIQFLVRHTVEVPVLYLATFRSEDVLQHSTLTRLTVQLAQDGLAQHLVLERLPLDAITELVQRTLNAGTEFVNRLYEHTQGNAFFTIETLRALAGSSLPEGRLPVPDIVRKLIQSRLEQISPTAREWITWAAVVGRTLDYALINRACGMDENTALEAVDELLRQGFLSEASGHSGNDYMFLHHLVHEAIYRSIHHRRKQRLHRLVGEAMEELYPDHAPSASALAYHFDAAGESRKALDYHDLAAQISASVFAWQEAEEHLGRMLWLIEKLNPQDDHPEYLRRRAQILIRRAELRSLQARLTERDADLDALNALASISGDEYLRLQIRVLRARFMNLDARYEQAIAVAEEGIILADQMQDMAAHCYLLTQIGFACYFLGKPRQALHALDEALRMTPKTDIETRRHILHVLGYVHFHLGNYACALAHQQESLAIHQTIGDYNGLAWAGLDMAATFQKMGRKVEAEQVLSQHLKLAEQIGSRSAQVYGLIQSGSWQLCQGNYLAAEEAFFKAMANLEGLRTEHARVAAEIGTGFALYHLGQSAEAQNWFQQALERARPIQHRRRVVEALIGLGLTTCCAGKYASARTFLTEAVAIARDSECRGMLAAGLAGLSRVERRCGNLSLAITYASETVRIADEIGWSVIQMWGEVEVGLSLLAEGDPATALEHTHRAVDLAPHSDDSWIGTEQVYLAHSLVLQASGQYEAANQAKRLSENMVEDKAARIPDLKRRQHYYEFVTRDV